MCGRYALSFRPSFVRQLLTDQQMPVDEAPSDDDEQLRTTYNFAPGYHGLIYRASVEDSDQDDNVDEHGSSELEAKSAGTRQANEPGADVVKHTLQTAKWGLIPFWTKRPPDYSSQLRTINCRDDSLIEDRGMWTSMKKRKRCIVIAEGFYEWLKKNDGKQKIPHFVKRSDGALMCFAGLWDMVQYEGSKDRLYSYTIITTDPNKQLKFLHDRMPVILDPESDDMKTWLDPHNTTWSKELQKILRPFQGDLECYPVDTAVGKVGNNSPNFVIPINSKQNKKNIANFFDKQKEVSIKDDPKEHRKTTVKVEHEESNAPLPIPPASPEEKFVKTEPVESNATQASPVKRKRGDVEPDFTSQNGPLVHDQQPRKVSKVNEVKTEPKRVDSEPKRVDSGPIRQTRSATSNNKTAKSPSKAGSNTRITQFFSGKS